MMVSRAGLPADHPVQMRFDRVMQVVDARLREATYFAGSEFTAADIMSFLAHHDAAFSAVQPAVLSEHPQLSAAHRRATSLPGRDGQGRSGSGAPKKISLAATSPF